MIPALPAHDPVITCVLSKKSQLGNHRPGSQLPGTNICDPSLQVYIGYQLGSQVVPCNGVSNVSLHYMVVSVIPVSNVISGRMGSQSHSYLILHCVLDTGFTSSLLYQRYYLMIPSQQAFHVNNWNQRIRVNDLYKPIVHSKCLLTQDHDNDVIT